jgi:ferrochelatase
LSIKAVILVNTGTPDSPDASSVRRYLAEFLGDRRIIGLPWLMRKLLVNLVIAPFRAPLSARKYKRIWTEKGSPLKVNHLRLAEKLQERAGHDYLVMGAMRYGSPSLGEALMKAIEAQADSVRIVPLYPQYASSTTGSVYEHVMKLVGKLEVVPEISFTGQFYSHHLYIEAVAGRMLEHDLSIYDHILFSYHGLPVRQVSKLHPGTECRTCSCNVEFPAHGTQCYRATAYETTRLIAGKLSLDAGQYSTSFQSRFASGWLEPFTDTVLRDLVSKGKRKVLVVAPSFTADCLETLYETGVEYRQMFLSLGGERLDLVESLNYDDRWVDALAEIAGIG